MIRTILCALALACGGCASCPAPSTAFNSQTDALAAQGYSLSGQVVSLLSAGKLSGSTAITLNTELQQAQADIRKGDTADAQKLINSVSAALAAK